MKTSKKLLICCMLIALILSLTMGTAVAFASEATKNHEFDAKNDVVFEDFDRADISDTVKASASGVALGEKPYLHVEFPAAETQDIGQIYKQGSGSIGAVKNGGSIIIVMRAPNGDVALSDINFAVRGDGYDSDEKVLIKSFAALKDTDGESLPALTAEWQTYEISFSTTYEETDVYPTSSNVPVAGGEAVNLVAIHIFANVGKAGTLDIASISYNAGGTAVAMNNFLGADSVKDTAKATDEGTWWADSTHGKIVKRTPVLTAGGSISIVKNAAVGDYSFAIIEATGDVANLKVATSTDGITWGAESAFDGYSIALTGAEKGIKLSYAGSAAGGVTIKRIYLTKLTVVPDAKVVPVIDAKSVKLLEDFSVAQTGFTGVWEDMSTAPELERAGLEYRLSYASGDKVEVKDGCLVFAPQEGYTNFKFKSKTAVEGSLIVLKLKLAGEGADLSALRFGTIGADDATNGDIIWPAAWKAGHNLAAKVLDTPYTSGEWKYVVIDLEESGLALASGSYAGMDIYYGGSGTLYIDEIFFANAAAIPMVDSSFTTDTTINFTPTDAVYQYAGYLYIPSGDGYVTTLEMDITAMSDDFDISGIRFEMANGVFWAAQNVDGTLKTVDGKTLAELTYTKGTATHVVIDLAASGIEGEFAGVHVHSNGTGTGAFKIENVKINHSTPLYEVKELDNANAVVSGNNIDFTPSADNYEYAGYVGSLRDGGAFKFDLTISEGTDVSGIRLGFIAGGVYWFSENAEGTLVTKDGKKINELALVAGQKQTIEIDLAASGIAAVSDFHVHTNGNGTGAFKLENVTVVPYADKMTSLYAQSVEQIPLYLDSEKPVITISTATEATAGDEIEIKYTLSDNATPVADLKVSVSVTKDGAAVTLANNKFVAEAGTYTVVVSATDIAGNEASETIQITVNKAGLGTGAIVGIILGVVAVVAIVAIVIVVLRKKKAK